MGDGRALTCAAPEKSSIGVTRADCSPYTQYVSRARGSDSISGRKDQMPACYFRLPVGLAYGLCLISFFPHRALGEETVGDKFRKVIVEIDARCKREKRGPYLDRSDPEYRKK